jgi:hypothetical protein
VNRSSIVMPSGTVGTDDLMRMASTNTVHGGKLDDLLDTPIHLGSGPTVYLRDIGTVENGTDIVVGYAHVNGKRTVYIPVTKRSDASTLAVIQRVRDALPRMKAVAPDDVDIRLEFDQSKFVVNAIKGLMTESALGALLTGVMVLLFLRDWRSSVIVILTIPFALLSAVVWLWMTGQTINMMTLGGLAVAVGVLVDEATVEIENIHSLLDSAKASGMSRAMAVVEACRKTAIPRLLAMLCVLSVFVPSFFMAGVARQLFVPLSIAVGFAMISSYVLSTTLVPVLGGIVKGGKIAFTVPAYPGETFYGILSRSAQSIDPKTRSMPVELDVSNPNGRLAAGLYPAVKWPIQGNRSVLLVPPTSIVTTSERTFVIRVSGSAAEWVDVKKGLTQGDLVEIVGPLTDGDTVLRRGSDEIRQGTHVNVRTVPATKG